MNVNVRFLGDVCVLEIIDYSAVSPSLFRIQILDELIEKGHKRFLVDLRQVKYLDSGGLGDLFVIKKHTEKVGGTVKLLNPNERVAELFKIATLNKVFEIFDNEGKAVESFRASSSPDMKG